MRFRSKERRTRVKDRSKNGKNKRAERGWGRKEGNFFASFPLHPLYFFGSRSIFRAAKTVFLVGSRSFFAPKPLGNACYAGWAFVSLRLKRNLTSVSDVCEAAPISLLWGPNGLNELPEVRFDFSFNMIGKLTMAFSTGQSCCVLKSW